MAKKFPLQTFRITPLGQTIISVGCDVIVDKGKSPDQFELYSCELDEPRLLGTRKVPLALLDDVLEFIQSERQGVPFLATVSVISSNFSEAQINFEPGE